MNVEAQGRKQAEVDIGCPGGATPQDEHRWLQAMVGSWRFESECRMGPDGPTIKGTGTERVRSLGGLWVIGEGEGEMPGGGMMQSVITLGFDPARGRFRGTFVASVMTHLWIYDGALDAAGRVLTLDTEGPDFSGGGRLVAYQDIVELRTADHRVLRSQARGPDGAWVPFMEAHYRRIG